MSTFLHSADVVTLLTKATLILAVAASVQALLRRASAAMRHGVWTLAIVALLALPLLSVALPAWTMALPSWAVEPAAAPAFHDTTAAAADRWGTIETHDRAPSSQAQIASTSVERTAWPGWPAIAIAVYVAGLVVLLARLLIDQRAARRLAASADEIRSAEWTGLLDECRTLMGIRSPVRLLRTIEQVTPMAIGIGSAAIVIPDAADAWTTERRRAVLLHELAHIERRDCLTQALASLVTTLYWIHPGAWWAARRLQVEREFACDDRVLGMGAGARDYAGHLLDIAYSLGGGRTPSLAVGMARRGQLEGRLLAVLDTARNRAMPTVSLRLLAAAASLALIVPLAAITASTRASAAALPVVDEPVATEPGAAATAPRDALALQTPLDATVTSGAWEIEPSDKPGRVYLELRQRHSSHGRDVALASLEGLSQSAMSGGHVTFTLRRDAGTFTFEGTFRNGVGAGAYTFAPSAAFANALQKRGIDRPTAAQQHEMAKSDVSLALLDDLATQGYEKPALDDLVRMGQHGVDSEFVRGMGQLGYRVGTIAALIKMRDRGVTPDYVRDLMAQGLPKLPAEDLVRARDHGVTPDYVQAMRQAGYGSLGVDALVNARDHGVTPDYIKGMAGLGYAALPLEALVNARDHGVTPDYAQALKDFGYRLDVKDLVRARDHGVTPDYVKELKALGYDLLSIDELITLRDHGVTPDKVKRANARAGSRLPPDMLRSLADGGSL